MKNLMLIALIVFSVTVQLKAQSVHADEIIDQINRGEDVRYENRTIEYSLDFTAVDTRQQVREGDSWFGWFGDEDKFESQIDVKIEFINCTFEGDVLAYYNENDAVYLAHFSQAVVFENCLFAEDAEFKYSEFKRKAIFSNSTFEEEANFKYAEFSAGPDFSGSRFEEDANFKYSKFKDQPDFSLTNFTEEANFKYANFPKGVTFEGATFEDLANFKYSEFSEPFNMDKVNFNGDEDFKYTKIEGKSFNTYLLKNRN